MSDGIHKLMGTTKKARASYRGKRPYKAVIKVGRKIIWECPHWHENRDQDNMRDVSASGCASKVLLAVSNLANGEPPLSRWISTHPHISPHTARADYERAKWDESVAPEILKAIKDAGGDVR